MELSDMKRLTGGPAGIRTLDLFHAMEARSEENKGLKLATPKNTAVIADPSGSVVAQAPGSGTEKVVAWIELPSGHGVLVDADDLEMLGRFRWNLKQVKGRIGYVRGRQAGIHSFVLIHRLITGASGGMVVDHINGDPLDNRRANLRVCTVRENTWNAKSSFGFRGVTFEKTRGYYRAQIMAHGKRERFQPFATAEEAARAFDVAAIRLHGEFARLNFPAPQPGGAL